MKPSPGLTWSVCFFERANIINISHTAYVCSTQGNFPEPCWGLGGGEVCSWMNHTWTCSKHPCWGIMRPNEVKNMNTPRLQQHLFLTLAPSWFFYSLPTPLSPSYPSPAPSLLLWSLRCAAQRRGAYLWCEHACIITHLPRAMDGSGGATDSAGTVADCAWKQRRPGLIWLSSRQRGCWQGSEVGWWESTKLAPDFALCLCLCGQRGGQNGRESESLQPHRPTRAYTTRNKLTQANKCW